MDVIQICPPKKLLFALPNDLHRLLTITNITLRSTFLYILNSHPYELSLSNQIILMQPFQQIKIDITINYNQQSSNFSCGKLRIYYLQVQQDEKRQQLQQRIFKQNNYQQIQIQLTINTKIINILNYRYKQSQSNDEQMQLEQISTNNKYYTMRQIYHNYPSSKIQQRLKNQILNYLQALTYVNSILDSQNIHNFIVQVQGKEKDFGIFLEFNIDQCLFIYSFTRIISYGKSFIMPSLVNIEQNISEIKQQKQVKSPFSQKNISLTNSKQMINRQIINKSQSLIKQQPIAARIQQKKSIQKSMFSKQALSDNKLKVKQSFILKNQQQNKKNKRRNRSQQKIVQKSDQSQDQQKYFMKQSFKELNFNKNNLNNNNIKVQEKAQVIIEKQIKIKYQTKITETNIQMSQKILNIVFNKKQDNTFVYVLLRDSIRCFMLEDPTYKKIFKFDPINQDHITMPSPMEVYQNQVIFGNQSYLFWVNLQNGYNQWKYVQRKYIYAIAVIEQLSLVAIGGKNFSKLSYFGKETSRSNIKLYSCSSEDKHDHLFTYDIPGVNVGNVANMIYFSAPPHNTKLLLVHTTNPQQSKFYFFRIKAFNKFQIYGQVQIDELGIINLLKIKYNKETQRIICMQQLGDINIDTFKKLKIKCQYEKVQINTEGFKFPLKRYLSYHIGGSKDSNFSQWMSLVEDNGTIFHIYQFQTNKIESFDIPKGKLKHSFWVNSGKYLVLGYESMIVIREKTQIQIKNI